MYDKFSAFPLSRRVPGSEDMRVLEETFTFYSDVLSVGIRVHKGYQSDLASVPRLFWRLIPPDGKHSPAAWVHDVLYEAEVVPRKAADDVFREALKELGVGALKRNIMYWAVRLGGGLTWDKHTDESIYNARTFVTLVHPEESTHED